MLAFYAQEYGGLPVMKLADLPDPTAERGEVVVAVRASSVNPLDWKLRNGDFKWITGSTFPKIFGADFAGVVESVGHGVSGLALGDRVYGFSPLFLRKPGAHAERLRIAAKRVRRMPENLSFVEAAALPVAALTALNGLRQCGDVAGQTVGINGATGGVGHFAVQIAKARGANVVAICSAKNADFAREIGADQIFDYSRTPLNATNRSYDVVFDAYGKLGFEQAEPVLAKDGRYVTTLPNPGVMLRAIWLHWTSHQRIIAASVRTKPQDYADLERLLRAGQLKPHIGKTVPLSKAAEAYQAAERGGTPGKLVIRIRDGNP